MLETDRLSLRVWQESDGLPFSKMNACPHVMRYFPEPMSRQASDDLVRKIQSHFSCHDFGLYALEWKASGAFIGFAGLSVPDFHAHFMPSIEIGWRLAYPYWGQGLATEAALRIRDHAFNVLELPQIVSFTARENMRSRRVMEKIGMHYHPEDDFHHPSLPKAHPLSLHVLYRLEHPS